MQMTQDYIEQYDVIRRYHQNRLTDEELNSFEIYILENPEVINVIEQEKIIHDAFRDNQSLLKDVASEEGGTGRWRMLAMAACLVVGVLAIFNYNQTPSYALQPPVVLETFRGAGDNAVTLGGAPVVLFQIDMGPAELLDANAFTAELVDASGERRFQQSGLTVDAEGWLFYALEGQDEPLSGRYTVSVYPDGNPGQMVSHQVMFTDP